MVKLKKILTCVLCVALVASLGGCTTYDNFKHAFIDGGTSDDTQTIKIGVFEPLTGEHKAEGQDEVNGIELANELYPEVCGKKVELVYADNKSDIYTGQTAIEELISANSPSVILGSYGETLTLIAGKAAKAAEIPAISISSTNPLITENNPYYFCATYSQTRQGEALAAFAYNSLEATKVAAIKIDGDDTATAAIKRFTNRYKKLSGSSSNVYGTLTLPTDFNDTESYASVIAELAESGADAVYLALSPSTAIQFMTQAKEAGLTGICYLGTRDWSSEDMTLFINQNKDVEIAFPSEEGQSSETSVSDEFVTAYKEKYGAGTEPSEAATVAFDAYCLALKAIENAYETMQNTDVDELVSEAATEAEGRAAKEELETALASGIPSGTMIRDALLAIEDFEGASGIINYGGSNEATKSITVKHFVNGQEVAAYTVE